MTTVHLKAALLPSGWADDVRLTFADGRIVAVTAGAPAEPGDSRGAVGLPGMANLHSHAFQRGLAGLTEHRGDTADSFWTWRQLMYRFVERLGPDDFEAITAQAYAEMLEAGFTRVGEFHYLHHAPKGEAYANPAEMSTRIIAAATDTGIGLTLLPVFYAHGGFGAVPVGAAQARFVHSPDSYAKLISACAAILPNVGIAPHSLRALTPDQLAAIIPLAGDNPIHIHIAEQTKEVDDCLAWSGARPVTWLLDHAAVDKRWCLVHATHMTREETTRLARTGAVAGLCPITEANLGDGPFPAPLYFEAGGCFGIGSDSNVLIDMAEELRLLEYGQRLGARARNILAGRPRASTGRALFDSALSGGAQALGATTGLAPNAPADVVVLDGDDVSYAARRGDAWLDSFIFAGGRIKAVWCAGRQVVFDGRHRDHARIANRFCRAMERILA